MKPPRQLGGKIPSLETPARRVGYLDQNTSPRESFEARLRDMYNEGEISPEDYIVRKKRLRDLMDEDDYQTQQRARGIRPQKNMAIT